MTLRTRSTRSHLFARDIRHVALFVMFVAVMVASTGGDAWACAVCFSPADPAVTESLNAGILVLLGITAAVLAGFARFILALVRRARHTAPLVEEPLA